MLAYFFISVALGALLVGLWYWTFLRLNRLRSHRILRWIEHAFGSHGAVSGVDWLTPSRMRVKLRLPDCTFQQPQVEVQMSPRELPLKWLLSSLRRREETLIFQSDLLYPPSHNMEIGKTRWRGRTQRLPIRRQQSWNSFSLGSMVISTRQDWAQEPTQMMSAVVSSRESEFESVSFRRCSPNFSVTFALSKTLENHGELAIFEMLRELAEGASTPRQ